MVVSYWTMIQVITLDELWSFISGVIKIEILHE